MHEKRLIRIGYVRTTAPYDYPCFVSGSECRAIGLVGDLWRTIARELNYKLQFIQTDSYGDLPDESGRWDGLTGLLLNRTIDATMGVWMTPELNNLLSFVRIGTTDTSMASKVINNESGTEINYAVFSNAIWMFIALSILSVFVFLLLTTKETFLDTVWQTLCLFVDQDTKMRTNILIYYGFVHILFLYNTKFKSDQVQSWLQKTVPVAEITQQLRTGQARLIAGHESIIKPFLLNEIYGTEYPKYKSGFSPVIEYSNMKIIEKICADSTLIYYGDIAALFAGEQPEPTCRYQRVRTTKASQLDFTVSYGLAFRKDFSRTDLNHMMRIANTVFMPDHHEEYFFGPYANVAYYNNYESKEQLKLQPLSLVQMRTSFVLLIIGLLMASVCLVLERFASLNSLGKRMVRSCCGNSRKPITNTLSTQWKNSFAKKDGMPMVFIP